MRLLLTCFFLSAVVWSIFPPKYVSRPSLTLLIVMGANSSARALRRREPLIFLILVQVSSARWYLAATY
jgi:hypothetical protein